MADPISIGFAIISAIGSLSSAKAESDAAKYNAKMAENNALLARQQGEVAERAQRIRGEKAIGKMAAAYSASGVTMEGSPLDVLAESAGAAELDALTVRHNYLAKAIGYENTARLDETRADNAMTTGYFKAASSALGAYSASSGVMDKFSSAGTATSTASSGGGMVGSVRGGVSVPTYQW